jgi:WD40 repeat protein
LVTTGPTAFPEVWDVATQEKLFSCECKELPGRNYQIALSADRKWLAQNTRSPRVWDLEGRKLLLTLPEERFVPWSSAWSPNQELLAVGSSSGGVVIWNLPRIKRQLDAIGLGW